MAAAVSLGPSARVDGKFFRIGEKRFFAKGVAYGPFAPDSSAPDSAFASPAQTTADFTQIRDLRANLLRIYQIPPGWFLELAAEHQLKLLIDIPWNKAACFLDSARTQREAIDAVRRAVFSCAKHPAVFAFSVANEIPPDIVRWSGAHAVADFIDTLIAEAKRADPDCLCTFTNFPPTEFLRPQTPDFVCFNLYLHQRPAFNAYLARLQMLADSKPLVLGECGIDSLREGEPRKCEILGWQIEDAFRDGLAGAIVFSFTDDWCHEGRLVEGWEMGLTTRSRQPRDSFRVVQKRFREAPYFPLPRCPRFSVIVASYNGERTLLACLESLERLNYPDYEVILVDDGSTDSTHRIAALHPKICCLRHGQNLGLSAARNTGIRAATGEIIAFTDSDCRVDQDWLHFLAAEFVRGDVVAVGGPNFLPPEDSPVAAGVMASPGGPAHVMLTDRQAEHIPGCNMAFFKSALLEIGLFDPAFHQAGDDVDICWRLQQAGYKIGFSAAAFVWHFRRSTITAYLAQQRGYGEAEAMLVRKHPENFNAFGGSLWRGRIYTHAKFGLSLRRPIVYRGLFGSSGFQALYASEPASTLMLCVSLEYHVLIGLPLWILCVIFHPLLPLAVTSLLLPLGVCAAAGLQAELPRKKARAWSRALVALLFFLQPIARGWARYRQRLFPRTAATPPQSSLDSIALRQRVPSLDEVCYSGNGCLDRFGLIAEILRRFDQRGWPSRSDIGWSEYDVELYDTRWCKLQITTAVDNQTRLRCRLRPRWSLRTHVAFWSLAGLELLVLGLLRPQSPWPWLLLLSLAAIALLLRRQQTNLQSIAAVLLDEMAKDLNLARQ